MPGRRYWRLYWKQGAGWIGMADYPLVARLCLLQDLAHRVHQKVEETNLIQRGLTTDGVPTMVVNHMLNDYLRIIGQIERLESLLGLNPVERSRIRVQAVTAGSSLDNWKRARA
jgi:hypothetical protein